LSPSGGKATRASRSFLQHFRGNLDNWDAPLVETLAESREVVLVDNTGVGPSMWAVPRKATEMARDAIAFVDAIGLAEIDLLGLVAPDQVRKRFAAALESARR
jgi:hypothetical protein